MRERILVGVGWGHGSLTACLCREGLGALKFRSQSFGFLLSGGEEVSVLRLGLEGFSLPSHGKLSMLALS